MNTEISATILGYVSIQEMLKSTSNSRYHNEVGNGKDSWQPQVRQYFPFLCSCVDHQTCRLISPCLSLTITQLLSQLLLIFQGNSSLSVYQLLDVSLPKLHLFSIKSRVEQQQMILVLNFDCVSLNLDSVISKLCDQQQVAFPIKKSEK